MKKSLDAYSATIVQLHEELQQLPPYHPTYEKIQDKLSRQLSAWSGKLSITIHVASNEQTGWNAEEIGYPVVPMATIKSGAPRQVTDYLYFLNDYDQFGGLCIERKGCTRTGGRMVSSDLYSSFAKKDNRRRFFAEVERFKMDPRFDSMILIAECSLGEYLSFKPAFNGKHYNKCNYGMNVPARRATLGKLHAIGCPVFFAGTRHHAVEMYRDFIIQKCRQDYKEILGIENDKL